MSVTAAAWLGRCMFLLATGLDTKLKIAAVILLVLGISLIIVSNFIVYMVIGEINARSSKEDQICFFFVQSKVGKILERHRALYPSSARRRQIYMVGVGGIMLEFSAFFLLIAAGYVSK